RRPAVHLYIRRLVLARPSQHYYVAPTPRDAPLAPAFTAPAHPPQLHPRECFQEYRPKRFGYLPSEELPQPLLQYESAPLAHARELSLPPAESRACQPLLSILLFLSNF